MIKDEGAGDGKMYVIYFTKRLRVSKKEYEKQFQNTWIALRVLLESLEMLDCSIYSYCHI
jgi:hypothetical protein